MDMLIIKYLPCKVVYITSSLFSNIVLWTNSKLKNKPNKLGDIQVGLKTLIHPKQKLPPRVLHCYTMAPTTSKPFLPAQPQLQPRLSSLWSSSPYVLQPTVMGDVIGTESGDCMMSEIEDYVVIRESKEESELEAKRESSWTREKGAMTREFPPPITLLRGTGRMPWVLTRECSDDGRLIMTVIITLEDDAVYCEECGYSMIFEEEELSDLEFNEEPERWERVDDEEKEEVGFEFEEESMAKEAANVVVVDFTYSDGSVQDSDLLWKRRIQDRNGLIGLMGRSGSAPLLQPLTPVM